MPAQPPNPLLPRIAAGDHAAVVACLDEFGPIILSLARRYLTPVHGDAESAVQDVFLELWRSAHRFDPSRGSEASFIMTLAHRRLIDRRRWHASRFSVGEPSPHAPDTAAPRAPRTVELRDDARAIAAALEKLPQDERIPIRLSIYHGLSHERIAASLGTPVGTIKTRIRRGLERLRAQVARPCDAAPAVAHAIDPSTRAHAGASGTTP